MHDFPLHLPIRIECYIPTSPDPEGFPVLANFLAKRSDQGLTFLRFEPRRLRQDIVATDTLAHISKIIESAKNRIPDGLVHGL